VERGLINPVLRRRLLGGYRRDDVDLALARARVAIRELEATVELLRARNHRLVNDHAVARVEVVSWRAREQEIGNRERRAAAVEAAAEAKAQEILTRAEWEAGVLRVGAQLRVEETTRQVADLLRLRDHFLRTMRDVIADFDGAVERVERGEPLDGDERPPELSELLHAGAVERAAAV
jgi:hypothetical protein